MAVLTVGLGLVVTSCKDDDDKGNSGNGTEAVDDQKSLEEYQLRSLISNFAGVNPSDVVLTQTYETEIGVVDDASKPNVRSIAVGTVEKADETAVMLLSALGIDAGSPSGFSYSSDLVGTATYQHGGGDANTLATISLGVKALPGLAQLRLTKTPGENAGGETRYKVGDIVKYKNRYWVCVYEAAAFRGNAYFVTFDHDGSLHKTSTFNWTPSWKDTYWQHDTPMADANILSYWLCNCVLNDADYNKVKSHYLTASKEGRDIHSVDDLNQMVPATDKQRTEFVNTYFISDKNSDSFITYMVSDKYTNGDYADDDDDVWETYDNGKGSLKAPTMLLCNATRYSLNVTSNNQYWVPYLFLCPSTQFTAFDNQLKAIPCENSSKFKYTKPQVSFNFTSPELQKSLGTNEISIFTAARYWEHAYLQNNKWLLFDFTKDWRTFKDTQFSNDDMWVSRCVTSQSMSIVDKGVTPKGMTDIYVAKEDNNGVIIENDEDYGAELKNKPDDDMGVYLPGDVVEDEDGSKWLCVWGAAHSSDMGMQDQTVWFISFDNIRVNNNMPDGIVEEDDVAQLAVRFASAVFYTTTSKDNGIYFKDAAQLGLWQAAYDNAGIDMSKMWTMRDSVWTFTNEKGKTYNSLSTSLFTNLAYRANDGTLKLLRTIADGTQGGTARNDCYDIDGKKHDMWQYLMYKHYEHYSPQHMRNLTNAEKGLGMTTWNIPWNVSADEMRFSDLSDQEYVDDKAADDKWVRLPLAGQTERQEPRTSANDSKIGWRNYIWSKNDKNFYYPGVKSMFNEPVLIMRLMKVSDQGGKRPYLKSQDGRKLKVVKMQDNQQMYDGFFNSMQNHLLKQYTNGGNVQSVYLDNEPYIMELN